ncbi:MAG: 1,4-alpha-glucan branching enzyme [Acidimicrobiaceae bacterium]|nr:1,4-alpha-glucan branching enzyme [Acidimicrobiaceae bacterium]
MTSLTTSPDLFRNLNAEIDRLVAGEQTDPHSLLGLHDDRIRAYRPDAVAMTVVGCDGAVVEMAQVHDAGVFEAQFSPAAGSYRLAARYRDGSVVEFVDPYRFWPTVGEFDLHLLGEGRHRRLWQMLGANCRTHEAVEGTAFAVWAPAARSVRVVGDFNLWDGRVNPMRCLGSSGVWELFIPAVAPGAHYKYEILGPEGHLTLKADPMAFAAAAPPATDSIVASSQHAWDDAAWLSRRDQSDWIHAPMSAYEVHLGSWRRRPEDGDRPLTYRELAVELPDYVADLGFTHVSLMPVAEHPFSGSWGYQVTSYYAPTSRYGTPDDFRVLVEAFHRRGIGVLVDWVPAHFPRDEWALARFDGTALYEHADPRQGEHPDWGTMVFNYGRNEVRNFLVSNALYWIEEFHVDGLRVDGVASMLYLDYSRREGEWIPNHLGGRENLEAVAFLKEMNEVVYGECPGVVTIAEESTSWAGVSSPTYAGGLGFGFKWNMGWMHDTLEYFAEDPVHRRYHHNELTFSMVYAYSENFMLPLSHDEVVHGKGSLLAGMPGDRWQKAANLRALYAWMWAHPGKQLLFMGGEIAQSEEWSHERSIDWHLLQYGEHHGVQDLVRSLNRSYAGEPALWQLDTTPQGFRWIDGSDADANVLSFLRFPDRGRPVACIANLSPICRQHYRVGLPTGGDWHELLNTDDRTYGGSGVGNGVIPAAEHGSHGMNFSAEITLPPLGVLWLVPAT